MELSKTSPNPSASAVVDGSTGKVQPANAAADRPKSLRQHPLHGHVHVLVLIRERKRPAPRAVEQLVKLLDERIPLVGVEEPGPVQRTNVRQSRQEVLHDQPPIRAIPSE